MGKHQTSRRRFLGSAGAAIGLSSLPLAYSVLGASARAQDPRYGILGQSAPEVSARAWIDKDGSPTNFDMDEIHGKWLYLKCFQSWCPGCHKYGFPTLQKVANAFGEHPKVKILAVQTVFEGFGINTEEKVREIQLRYDLPITMGHDPGNPDGDHRPSTMRHYRTGGTPWIVIVDPSARVIFNDFHVDGDRFIGYLKNKLQQS